MKESIPELETHLQGFIALEGEGDIEFSRDARNTINRLAYLSFLKNPLIKRAVHVFAQYVWAKGFTVKAEDDLIQEVVMGFLNDRKNYKVIFDHPARVSLDKRLSIYGELFFKLTVQPETGFVRISLVPSEEIVDILKDMDDNPVAYLRKRSYTTITGGKTRQVAEETYIRDYEAILDVQEINRVPVAAQDRMYHVKLGWSTFGQSEVYASLDWVKAYKDFLSDFATLVRSVSRFAWKLSTEGGKTAITSAKNKLAPPGTPVSQQSPVTGSTFVSDPSVKLDVVNSAGAVTPASAGRELLLMAIAGFGLPETFYGNVSVGTLATAKSLDRPTELLFLERQKLWQTIYINILWFVLLSNAQSPKGSLRNFITMDYNAYNELGPVFKETIDTSLNVTFPPILDKEVEYVDTIIKALSFGGQEPKLIKDPRSLLRILLPVLGLDLDIDTIIADNERLELTDEDETNV